LKSNEVKVRTS